VLEEPLGPVNYVGESVVGSAHDVSTFEVHLFRLPPSAVYCVAAVGVHVGDYVAVFGLVSAVELVQGHHLVFVLKEGMAFELAAGHGGQGEVSMLPYELETLPPA